MKKNFALIIFCFSLFIVSGCSVKYEQETRAFESNPEFVFTNTVYTKIENNQVSTILSAGTLEKYKNNSAIYANDVEFQSFDKNNEVTNSGSCGYLYADTDSEIYELFDDIKINSTNFNAKFSADSLKFNAQNEQLVGSKNDTVIIEKEDSVIYGTGFSASGISNSFTFSGTVTGQITTKEGEDKSE